MYGPRTPRPLAIIALTEIPVCLRHVGYVSIDCKLIAKKLMVMANFTKTVNDVAYRSNSVSVGYKRAERLYDAQEIQFWGKLWGLLLLFTMKITGTHPRAAKRKPITLV